MKKGKEIVKFYVNFEDLAFNIQLNPENASQVLNTYYGNDIWNFNLIDSALKNCPMHSHESGVSQNECERDLELAMAGLLKEKLSLRLVNMLSEIPAPQFFNVVGKSETELLSTEQSKLQVVNRVDFYGQYIPQ